LSKLLLQHITKRFEASTAVDDVTLEIQSGEFFSFLGPSGCGKTTLLRIIAGFEVPTDGRVLIDDVDVTSLPAQRRDTVMVFQNYALFPHMTVEQNVAFGPETRRIRRSEIERQVLEALELVQLEHKKGSAIQDLSGGEQQRVALARAVVVRPKILLMDEPLSNLDITLRAETRTQIKQLQQATGITTVYVTHDQGEALGLSDRIAVMDRGHVIQAGTPTELFTQPAHVFVASFLGNANVLKGRISRVDSNIVEIVSDGGIRFSVQAKQLYPLDTSVLVAVRPEHIRLVCANEPFDFKATVDVVEFQGTSTEYRVRAANQQLRAVVDGSSFSGVKVHDEVGVKIDPLGCFIYPWSGD
jgi:iron(III) transport system ATP-binding protein